MGQMYLQGPPKTIRPAAQSVVVPDQCHGCGGRKFDLARSICSYCGATIPGVHRVETPQRVPVPAFSKTWA